MKSRNVPSPSFLRQFRDLKLRDFEQNPVWISVHGVDDSEPWYDNEGIDETTFRPYRDGIPINTADGILLVAATFRLADGSEFAGFFTPVSGTRTLGVEDLGASQPVLFTQSDEQISFWKGWMDPRPELVHTYALLAKGPSAVFPARYTSNQGLFSSAQGGTIPGFCWRAPTRDGGRELKIEH